MSFWFARSLKASLRIGIFLAGIGWNVAPCLGESAYHDPRLGPSVNVKAQPIRPSIPEVEPFLFLRQAVELSPKTQAKLRKLTARPGAPSLPLCAAYLWNDRLGIYPPELNAEQTAQLLQAEKNRDAERITRILKGPCEAKIERKKVLLLTIRPNPAEANYEDFPWLFEGNPKRVRLYAEGIEVGKFVSQAGQHYEIKDFCEDKTGIHCRVSYDPNKGWLIEKIIPATAGK